MTTCDHCTFTARGVVQCRACKNTDALMQAAQNKRRFPHLVGEQVPMIAPSAMWHSGWGANDGRE